MRAQSSVEFLATYSFLFLILGVIISVLVFVSIGISTVVPQQCTSFAGPNCNFVGVYSSKSGGYSLITFSITNSQSVPIDITSMNTTIKSINYPGSCTPSFLYPGQEATCISNITVAYSTGVNVQGSYSLTAGFCNSGISALSTGTCVYDGKQSYGGSFTTSPVSMKQIIFSAIASQAPASQTANLISYNSLSSKISNANAVNSLSLVPNNYTIMQNGDFVTNATGGTISFAFATNGPMQNKNYFSLTYNTLPFPSTVSVLNNNAIWCGATAPYRTNSTFSVFSTTLYLSASAPSVSVQVETDGASEVFYRQAAVGVQWASTFGGGSWKQQAATANTATVSLNKGFNDVSVVWSNPCGPGGQVVKISGLPSN